LKSALDVGYSCAMSNATVERGASPAPPHAVRRVTAGVVAAACLLAAAPAAAQDVEAQLQEIRTLVREKRYALALESLSLVARQIQAQRLEAVTPAFPAPPKDWTAQPALSLLEDHEIWGNRIAAQRAYVATMAPARIDLAVDIHSPFVAAVSLSFNPLALAGDPATRVVEVGGEKGLLRFNPDTREGELYVLVGREVLVTARGHGIASPEPLVELARGVDYSLLRGNPLP
jgi:hypothetical protein